MGDNTQSHQIHPEHVVFGSDRVQLKLIDGRGMSFQGIESICCHFEYLESAVKLVGVCHIDQLQS